MPLKGKLVVAMRFEVPVSERMYAATLRDKGAVTVETFCRWKSRTTSRQ